MVCWDSLSPWRLKIPSSRCIGRWPNCGSSSISSMTSPLGPSKSMRRSVRPRATKIRTDGDGWKPARGEDAERAAETCLVEVGGGRAGAGRRGAGARAGTTVREGDRRPGPGPRRSAGPAGGCARWPVERGRASRPGRRTGGRKRPRSGSRSRARRAGLGGRERAENGARKNGVRSAWAAGWRRRQPHARWVHRTSARRLPATTSSAVSSRSSAMRLSLKQDPFRRGAAPTRTSQAVSRHGTQREMWRSGLLIYRLRQIKLGFVSTEGI